MTNKQKLLKILKHGVKTGKVLHGSGLCLALSKENILFKNLNLFHPSEEEISKLMSLQLPWVYWGMESFENLANDFTKLRETVLCFLIAMEK